MFLSLLGMYFLAKIFSNKITMYFMKYSSVMQVLKHCTVTERPGHWVRAVRSHTHTHTHTPHTYATHHTSYAKHFSVPFWFATSVMIITIIHPPVLVVRTRVHTRPFYALTHTHTHTHTLIFNRHSPQMLCSRCPQSDARSAKQGRSYSLSLIRCWAGKVVTWLI